MRFDETNVAGVVLITPDRFDDERGFFSRTWGLDEFQAHGLETRVARYHNVYGPHGTWEGGREKAPAAICRKVIHAKHTGSTLAASVLSDWPRRSAQFTKVMPRDYQRVLEATLVAKREGRDVDTEIMEASRG